MSRREISLGFLQAFCDGDLEVLRSLLAVDCRFEGPFHRFASREAYLRSLEADPPGPRARAEVHRIFEDGDDICLFYDYVTPGHSVRIAQWNHFREDKIDRIVLVFDGRGVA